MDSAEREINQRNDLRLVAIFEKFGPELTDDQLAGLMRGLRAPAVVAVRERLARRKVLVKSDEGWRLA